MWENNRLNVSDIRKKITGVSYLSKFYFEIDTTRNVDFLYSGNIAKEEKFKDLFFYATNISVPNRLINTEAYTYANGYRMEVPIGTTYGDGTISVQIRMDENYYIYDMFKNWMDKIHNKSDGYFEFYDNYVTNMRIFQLPYTDPYMNGVGDRISIFKNNISQYNSSFDSSSAFTEDKLTEYKKYYKFELLNCYPKTMSAIEFSHESKEKVMLTVNFTYEGINYNTADEKVAAS